MAAVSVPIVHPTTVPLAVIKEKEESIAPMMATTVRVVTVNAREVINAKPEAIVRAEATTAMVINHATIVPTTTKGAIVSAKRATSHVPTIAKRATSHVPTIAKRATSHVPTTARVAISNAKVATARTMVMASAPMAVTRNAPPATTILMPSTA